MENRQKLPDDDKKAKPWPRVEDTLLYVTHKKTHSTIAGISRKWCQTHNCKNDMKKSS